MRVCVCISQGGQYLQLVGVGAVAADLAGGPGPSEHQGLQGPLARHATDLHPLKEVHVHPPDGGRTGQPAVPTEGGGGRITTT